MCSHLRPRTCLRVRAVGAAVVAFTSLLLIGSANAASFDIVGVGQSYTLPTNFDPNWSSTPQGFTGSGPGTVIDIFYGANGSSPYSPDPMTFTAPTASGAGLGISGANGPVSLTYTFLGFEAAYTNQAEASFTYSSTPMFQKSRVRKRRSDCHWRVLHLDDRVAELWFGPISVQQHHLQYTGRNGS